MKLPSQKTVGQISMVLGFVLAGIGTLFPFVEIAGNILAAIVFGGGFYLKERSRDKIHDEMREFISE